MREVDLAPLKWNVSIGVLCRESWNIFFVCSFLILKRVYILQISSIALKFRSKYGTSRATNISLRSSSSEQTNGSALTNNKIAVDSLIMRFSVHVNLLIFYLEINSFFEDITVNTEERRKGRCEGKFKPLSLWIRKLSRIYAVDRVKLVYHVKQQIESLNKH